MTTINRRQAIAATTAAALAPAAAMGSTPATEIERLFCELTSTTRAVQDDDLWERDDVDEIDRLQAREDHLLTAIAAKPATTITDIVRKIQAWALVARVNPEDIRQHGPSEDLPEPACMEIIASALDDTRHCDATPMNGLDYPRRRLPGWIA